MVSYDFEKNILYGDQVAPIYNPNVSLGHILLHYLEKDRNHVMQVFDDDDSEMTYLEIANLTRNFAKNMLKRGYKPGDVVGLVGRNSPNVTPAIFGCFLIELIISPIELADLWITFDVTKPKIIICDHDILPEINKYVSTKAFPIEIVVLTAQTEGYSHISDFFLDAVDVNLPATMKGNSSETVAALMTTSGTTGIGRSKVAKVSHAQLFSLRTSFGDTEGDIFGFVFSQYSWITGLAFMVYCVLNREKRLITSASFNPNKFFELLEKHKFTHFMATPGLIRQLQQSPKYDNADFSSVKKCVLGGTLCPLDMINSIKIKMPNAILTIVYGSTERTSICMTEKNDPVTASVGKPFPGVQIKIVHADGSEAGMNESGEILIKTTGKPFLGYVDNEALTSAALTKDGWFQTSDVGFIDKEFNLTIIGRKAFIIKSMSHSFQPLEIENILDRIPGVRISCVLGLPTESEDELPTALIIKDGSVAINENIVCDAVLELGEHKQLRGGVFFVDEFILSSTGKIIPYKMKQMAIKLRNGEKSNIA